METTRESKIKRINEVMSDKTLSFWCVIIIKDNDHDLQKCRITWLHYWDYVFNTDIWCVWEVEKCIWHPVMIWDVLDFIEKLDQWLWEDHIKVWSSVRHKFDTKTKIIEDKRKHKRLPIDDQSEECIDFIYNLIQDDN